MHQIIDKELLDKVLAIAIVAGKAVMAVYNQDFKVDKKSDNSPITKADRDAHNIIVKGLAQISDLPQLSEEQTNLEFQQRQHWQQYWIIDPVDGTREFVNRNGEFTVNIGLVENNRAKLGVVHRPTTKESFIGIVGQGAWYVNANGDIIESKCQQLPNINQKLRFMVSRSHPNPDIKGYIELLSKHYQLEQQSVGSSLKMCLIAVGVADIYIRSGATSQWDTAAAQAVLEAAGGSILQLDNLQQLQYNRQQSLLNPHFIALGSNHLELLNLLNNEKN